MKFNDIGPLFPVSPPQKVKILINFFCIKFEISVLFSLNFAYPNNFVCIAWIAKMKYTVSLFLVSSEQKFNIFPNTQNWRILFNLFFSLFPKEAQCFAIYFNTTAFCCCFVVVYAMPFKKSRYVEIKQPLRSIQFPFRTSHHCWALKCSSL